MEGLIIKLPINTFVVTAS